MSYVFTGRGLGESSSQTVAQVGGIGAPVAAAATAPLLTSAVGASLAIPIAGVAISAVLVGIEAILNSGCGQTCVETSQWANQAEAQLKQLVTAYFAVPAPRTQNMQQVTMAGFMSVWNKLVADCSQPGLSTAGQNCIADRQDGACKWKATKLNGFPGEPAIGQCWNWWNGYYWPVANDPTVPDAAVTDAAETVAATTSAATAAASSLNIWLLVGAAALIGLAAIDG